MVLSDSDCGNDSKFFGQTDLGKQSRHRLDCWNPIIQEQHDQSIHSVRILGYCNNPKFSDR